MVILSVLLCTSGLYAQTQGNTGDILKKMGAAIEEAGAVDIRFEITVTNALGEETESYSGRVEIDKNAFKMVSGSFEIFCDGESKWFLNSDFDELTIFPNDTTQVDIVENPIGFLKSLSKENSGYRYAQRSPSDASGTLWQVELSPENRRSPYKKLLLAVDKSTYLPLWFEYIVSDDTSYRIEITSFKHVAGWPVGNFVFPESRKKALHITDLR